MSRGRDAVGEPNGIYSPKFSQMPASMKKKTKTLLTNSKIYGIIKA
nr:MAG TPA: hypothetical protein [Caudoviricetes sp.]